MNSSNWVLSEDHYNLVSHNRVLFKPDDLRKTVNNICYDLKRLKRVLDYNALVGIGHSGSPLLGALSYKLGIPIGIVRKKVEEDKSTHGLGAIRGLRYVFIDDLIDQGTTIRHVISTLDKQNSTCVAILLYENWRNLTEYTYNDKKIPVYTMSGKFPGGTVIRTGI